MRFVHNVYGDDAPDPDKTALVVRPLVKAEVETVGRDATLLREWLSDSLPTFCFFSAFVPTRDEGLQLTFYQVISQPARMITINTYDVDLAARHRSWGLLAYDVWQRDALLDRPTQAFLVGVEETTRVDLVSLLGAVPDARHDIQVWTREPSDLEGCVFVCNPVPAQPLSDLHDKCHPLLGIQDALVARGYMRVFGKSRIPKTRGCTGTPTRRIADLTYNVF